MRELLSLDEIKEYVIGFFDLSKVNPHMTAYQSGVFFSTFVMMQLWNLLNTKYFNTDRSLLKDIADIVTRRRRFSDCFSNGFVVILGVILFGQILIVNGASSFFEVAPLPLRDWLLILLATSPIFIVPDLVRTLKRS